MGTSYTGVKLLRPETKSWMKIAEKDMTAAEILFGKGIFDMALFHAQQARGKDAKGPVDRAI